MKTLIIIIIVILIIYFLFFYNKTPTQQPYYIPETFDTELNQYYFPGSHGAEDIIVDKLACHSDCHGYSEPTGLDQWHSPFDGLTADELKQSIATKLNDEPFIRTSYTC